MRRLAFILAISGLLILALFLNAKPTEISELSELEDLEINQKVLVSAKVAEEKFYGDKKIFILNSGIEAVCECAGDFKGKEIAIEGIVSEFNEKKQISVLKIKLLE